MTQFHTLKMKLINGMGSVELDGRPICATRVVIDSVEPGAPTRATISIICSGVEAEIENAADAKDAP